MKQLIYCKGVWHSWIKVGSNLGLWRADGAVEVLEARSDVLFHWDDHFERLGRSCRGYKNLDLSLLPSEEEILAKTQSLLRKESLKEAIVHILVTPGKSTDLKKAEGWPELIIDVRSLNRPSSIPPLKLVTKNARRYFPECKLTAGYGYVGRLQAEAEACGFDSFLYWDEYDGILEGPYENFFVVTNSGWLCTPSINVLKGVTRKILLDLAKKHKVFESVDEVPRIRKGFLYECREAFLSSTTKGAAAIGEINGYHFNVGKDSKVEKLQELFLEYRENYYKARGA
ncbi:MAG: aminotransferase class IV [bacterium]|nr:aminotransferase class IV [bacterium]